MTRARALRDGLALIRETVGDDAFILRGCRCSARLVLWTRCASGRTHRRAGVRTTTDYLCLVQMAKFACDGGAIRNTLERAWMDPAL